MIDEFKVGVGKLHLVGTSRKRLRLPITSVWALSAEFAGTPQGETWTVFIHPVKPINICVWSPIYIGVLMEEAERFLVPGMRFYLSTGNWVVGDGELVAPSERFGEGVIEQVRQVSPEVFKELFGDPWQLL
jgi:hypothetical protein